MLIVIYNEKNQVSSKIFSVVHYKKDYEAHSIDINFTKEIVGFVGMKFFINNILMMKMNMLLQQIKNEDNIGFTCE